MQLSGKVLSQHTLEFEPQHHKINKISKLISTVWSQESQLLQFTPWMLSLVISATNPGLSWEISR
jgi:hypothetical protein